MKSALSFAAGLLGAGLTGATPFAKDGVTYDLVPAEPVVAPRKAEHVVRNLTVESVEKAQVCVIDIYRAGNPAGLPVTINANFDFTSFCSAYLPDATGGPASTTLFFESRVTTTAAARTASVTKTAVTTVQANDPAHAQVQYCPISNAGTTCNVTAWAGTTGAFHAGTEDIAACHQLCLSTATCKSFQVSAVTGTGIIPQCNLYTVSAGGTTNGTGNFNIDPKAPYVIYDRDCPDALPVGCHQTVPIRTTTVAPPPPVPATSVAPTVPAVVTSFITVIYQPPSSVRTTAAPPVPTTSVAPTVPAVVTSFITVIYQPPSSVRTTAAPPVPTTSVAHNAPSIITSFVTVTYQPPSGPFSVAPGGPKGGEVARDVEEKGLEVARDVEEKGLEARDNPIVPPPWILSLIGTVTLSAICSCILSESSPSSTATVYGPSYVYATVTPTVYKTVTAFNTVTTLVSGTVYSSVA